VLLVLCEMEADITPWCSAAGNSLSDAYRWIKVSQDLVKNSIIDKTKREIAGDDKLNQQALQMLLSKVRIIVFAICCSRGCKGSSLKCAVIDGWW
jgi:hypothetical protein